MFSYEYTSNLTGEIVTIVFTDGLYVKLSNDKTIPGHEFFRDYTKLRKRRFYRQLTK